MVERHQVAQAKSVMRRRPDEEDDEDDEVELLRLPELNPTDVEFDGREDDEDRRRSSS